MLSRHARFIIDLAISKEQFSEDIDRSSQHAKSDDLGDFSSPVSCNLPYMKPLLQKTFSHRFYN